ncbi:MAG: hypothetical protein LUE64_02070 [Candidatus Gastranaerophilales bacterium]|nr:hypothetical protein [Candidatus Gastranaerophilales bacterium]
MEIKSGSFNVQNFAAPNARRADFSPAFKGKEKVLQEIGKSAVGAAKKSGIKEGITGFVKKYFTEGTDVTYRHRDKILNELKQNFGETFTGCFEEIDLYNNLANTSIRTGVKKQALDGSALSNKLRYTLNPDDSITFHKDPLFKSILDNCKEFTEGTVLDIGVSARNLFRKITKSAPKEESSNFINRLLDRRVAQKEAVDSFYRLSGIFEKVTGGAGGNAISNMGKSAERIDAETQEAISRNIVNLAKDSVGKATKKVGKYNTKTERAWNRLGTGFVSATFAYTDFYNISMLQNNDTQKANQAGRKRFAQDMRRQSLTAGITFVVLGALQKSVNNSLVYAVLSLGGVSLLSEILSRKIGGISLLPLSPKDAAEAAKKKKTKDKKSEENSPLENEQKKDTEKTLNSNPFKETNSVYNVFTDKINEYSKTGVPVFGAIMNENNTTAQTQDSIFEKAGFNMESTKKLSSNQNEQISPQNKKKKSPIWQRVLKYALAIVGVSLGIGLLRTKNVFGVDDILKKLSSKYNNFKDAFTTKPIIMEKDEVDSFLEYLTKNNFNKQHDEITKALEKGMKNTYKGTSSFVQKNMPKRKINPNGKYYNLGRGEARAKKIAYNVLTYPINAASKLIHTGDTIVRGMFGQKHRTAKGMEKLKPDTAAEFINKYATKYKNASGNSENLYHYRKELEDAFTRHFSEANSQNKNTTVAMTSRFLITLISSYFFVNDYRNQVLIESEGKDVERANSTMRERIGHKISNFFLNSMFMDLFNTTFENTYLGSVPGAVAVAMATEFTNESTVRASICTPRKKMTREELIEYENERINDDGLRGRYYRAFMKLTGKKPLSEKAKG